MTLHCFLVTLPFLGGGFSAGGSSTEGGFKPSSQTAKKKQTKHNFSRFRPPPPPTLPHTQQHHTTMDGDTASLARFPFRPYYEGQALRICVTGAGGFIASNLGKRLKKEGHYVVACDWKRNEHLPVSGEGGRVAKSGARECGGNTRAGAVFSRGPPRPVDASRRPRSSRQRWLDTTRRQPSAGIGAAGGCTRPRRPAATARPVFEAATARAALPPPAPASARGSPARHTAGSVGGAWGVRWGLTSGLKPPNAAFPRARRRPRRGRARAALVFLWSTPVSPASRRPPPGCPCP